MRYCSFDTIIYFYPDKIINLHFQIILLESIDIRENKNNCQLGKLKQSAKEIRVRESFPKRLISWDDSIHRPQFLLYSTLHQFSVKHIY